LNSRYVDEGYSALDVPTSAAVNYVRERQATLAQRRASELRASAANAEAARTLLVVDAGCDLPSAWLHLNHVAVVPFYIHVNGEVTRDTLDESPNIAFASERLAEKGLSLHSMPLTPVEIRDHLQLWMSPQIDHVLQLTFSAARSKAYVSALQATQSLVLIHNKVRRSIANRGPLRAWVIDSQTGLTGMAIMVAQAVRLRDRGLAAAEIAAALEQFRNNVHTLVVADDLDYLFQMSQREGAAELPRWKQLFGKLFDLKPVIYVGGNQAYMVARPRHIEPAFNHAFAIAARHVKLGLSSPYVCVSHAGDPAALLNVPGFVELGAECRRRQVELITAPMNMTGSLKLGPGAVAVSFASARYLG